jgi:hypothetical protein
MQPVKVLWISWDEGGYYPPFGGMVAADRGGRIGMDRLGPLIGAFGRRRKWRTLLERLKPYQPRSLSHEAQSVAGGAGLIWRAPNRGDADS